MRTFSLVLVSIMAFGFVACSGGQNPVPQASASTSQENPAPVPADDQTNDDANTTAKPEAEEKPALEQPVPEPSTNEDGTCSSRLKSEFNQLQTDLNRAQRMSEAQDSRVFNEIPALKKSCDQFQSSYKDVKCYMNAGDKEPARLQYVEILCNLLDILAMQVRGYRR